MKMLLATHHCLNLGGSELFLYTLAKYLKKNYHHDVIVYSPFITGILREKIKKLGVKVVNDLRLIKNIKFDVIHLSHNIIAYEARNYFPDIPAIFVSHGPLPFLEQPPIHDLNIQFFVAVSEEVKENLVSKGIPLDKIKIIRNPIDTERFRPYHSLQNNPKNILMIPSMHVNISQLNIVKQAAKKLKLTVEVINGKSRIWDIEKKINNSDIIIGYGRIIIEALLCRKAAIVFDYLGGDGMVSSQNFHILKRKNFSGRTFRKFYNVDELVAEIAKYNVSDIKLCYQLAYKEFNAVNITQKFVDIYNKAISHFQYKKFQNDFKYIDFICKVAIESRQPFYCCFDELNYIQNLEGWKLLNKCYRIADKILPMGSRRRKVVERILKWINKM